MPADNKPAKELIDKYRNGSCTPEERAMVEAWYASWNEDMDNLSEEQLVLAEDRVFRRLPGVPAKTKRLWPRIAAAASVILMLSAGGYFLFHKQAQQQTAQIQKQDLQPGSNKAILTLSNGKQISLTDAKNGTIASEENTTIQKAANGTISYAGNAGTKSETLVYNTISTPRGGQWPVVILPDGTKAILDAASSIKYPVAFNTNERKVEITGQVYFEVVHNSAKPFRVSVKGQIIEDIGTHFNVNAYDDEPNIRTTLIEGGIKIAKGPQAVTLKPGQEAVIENNTNSIRIQNADIQQTIAWTNGIFLFHNNDMQTVMRQLARWYDVEIVYEGKIPQRTFSGDFHRSQKGNQILDLLSFYKVHFKIDGKKIIVKEQ